MIALFKIVFCFSALCLSALVQVPLLQLDTGSAGLVAYDYSLIYLCTFALSISFKTNYTFAALIIYLLAGLAGLPIFAFGGGLSYIFEPSFGYLLGLFPLSILAFFFKYHVKEFGLKSFSDKSLGPLMGFLVAHAFGIVFLLITGRLSLENLLSMSSYQLFYDLFFGYLLLSLL